MFYFIERIVALARYYNVPLSIRDEKLAGTFIGNTVAGKARKDYSFSFPLTSHLGALSVIYILLFIVVVVKYMRIGILIVSVVVVFVAFSIIVRE